MVLRRAPAGAEHMDSVCATSSRAEFGSIRVSKNRYLGIKTTTAKQAHASLVRKEETAMKKHNLAEPGAVLTI